MIFAFLYAESIEAAEGNSSRNRIIGGSGTSNRNPKRKSYDWIWANTRLPP